MSNNRYIELSSAYRNRKIWPVASEFQIPISQSGTSTTSANAIDPVSLAMPLFAWSSNDLLLGGSQVIPVLPNVNTANIANPAGTNMIGYTSESSTFIITTLGVPQQLRNYYTGLVINDANASNSAYRRIISSYYLGVDSGGKYRTQITVLNSFGDSLTYGDKVYIYDPTDFSDPNHPIIFVPNAFNQENAYNGYILYNETCNQYRPILRYDNAINCIILDTSGSVASTNSSGPITVGVGNWQTTDNFSLRKAPLTFPPLAGTNPAIASISSGNTIVTNFVAGMSTTTDYYKNYFIRILPYGSSVGAGDTRYEYEPTPSNNVAYKIISYTPNSPADATFVVNPSFSTSPSVGASVEILPFSYDNFSPFVYSGSMVSQQEMVCYDLQLVSLTMPNATLTVANGGRTSFYPFVYIQISNVSASGAGLKNIIYSNNPNANSVIFRAPVYDVQNPLSTPFVRIDASGMTQTIKFKPNDNLYLKISLPNGELIKTILEEYFSPAAPNSLAQITALFSVRRTS